MIESGWHPRKNGFEVCFLGYFGGIRGLHKVCVGVSRQNDETLIQSFFILMT